MTSAQSCVHSMSSCLYAWLLENLLLLVYNIRINIDLKSIVIYKYGCTGKPGRVDARVTLHQAGKIDKIIIYKIQQYRSFQYRL